MWNFSAGFGYTEGSAEEMLGRLADRIGMYAGRELVFPHEIGVFLDYPLADVEGFIRNAGRDYLLSGYWKVYHDPALDRVFSEPMTGPGTAL